MMSLIIPTYKREKLLVDCLKCAFEQKGVEYEVIVVDQTHDHQDETKSFLDSSSDKMRYFLLDRPSVTYARNKGIEEAKGNILVFIDDDTTFEQHFLLHHLQAHEGGADVVGGRILEKGSKVAKQPVWITPMIRFRGSDTCATSGKTNSVTGCNFSFSRKVSNQIGGFDTHFYGSAVREDSEFAYRAYKSGFNCVFSAEAELFHHRSPSGGVETGIKSLYLDPSYYFSEFYFARKHFSSVSIFQYRIRLFLRGLKQLIRLIKTSEQKARDALSDS